MEPPAKTGLKAATRNRRPAAASPPGTIFCSQGFMARPLLSLLVVREVPCSCGQPVKLLWAGHFRRICIVVLYPRDGCGRPHKHSGPPVRTERPLNFQPPLPPNERMYFRNTQDASGFYSPSHWNSTSLLGTCSGLRLGCGGPNSFCSIMSDLDLGLIGAGFGIAERSIWSNRSWFIFAFFPARDRFLGFLAVLDRVLGASH
jgi:hypothetical protein